MTKQLEMNFEKTATIRYAEGRWPIPQAQWPRMALRDWNNPDTVRQSMVDKATRYTHRVNECHPAHGKLVSVWYGNAHTVESVRAFFTMANAEVFAYQMARSFAHVTITQDRY